MIPDQLLKGPVYSYQFTIPVSAVDQNGHINNVMYVGWMQDVAMRHYEAMGGNEPTQALGATWVVRSHKVEYLLPAYAGELLVVQTWVVDMRRVRSTRRYRFLRASDEVLLVRGETEWVFVDAATDSPRSITPEVASLFTLYPDRKDS